ncbi:VOC family protein [Nocardioides panzhihuensis]|uniref:Catechol 2,3-dioxygenase-like lactoylglutathione lyase family enzyme n=1 Tax=Nocardioides panzhihuensis TaxID=860243 RepID=A0A7Z0IQ86_9ACTN|nr:VOC family protein [Nocardioides panzhihuensis]NYI75679.1 catechol 2,3-dioxygenase-like lactoylglutathione lyase family enzyme [Nocardioides panzhihuensis]
MPDLRLDHVGIQVRELLRTAEAFERLFGYRRVTAPVVNTRHGVRGVFLEKADSISLKLITPLSPGPHAYGLHHLAFMAPDLDSALVELGVAGARTLSPPQPGEMFDDELIAFVRAAGVNVELITTDRRRGRIG